jgi:hypothetical protein
MISESARMTTRAEARYRIEAPNSQPRAVKVIALDAASELVVKRLAQLRWNRATFLTASAFAGTPARGGPFSVPGWLSDLAGRTKDLIGEACMARRVMTTGLVLGTAAASDEALSKTLGQLRPYSVMLVAGGDEEYIENMLVALRA